VSLDARPALRGLGLPSATSGVLHGSLSYIPDIHSNVYLQEIVDETHMQQAQAFHKKTF
jgi:hypothetical protein